MSIFGKRENVIAYTVNREVNNDMYITVQNGEVVVNAPWYFTSNKIQEILKEKKNWILGKINEHEKSISNIQTVKIFGRDYDVKVVYKNVNTAELNVIKNSEINIILPNKYKKIGNEQILKVSIQKMYEQIANNEIEGFMEKVRINMGIAPEEYRIQKMQDTLGKCLDGKIIVINPELMKFKKETIEYVITHEFCHLKYKSHGKKFYEMIENNIVNYKKCETEIQGYLY
ncbi:MAG: M48 family metallopeptidase [Clostridia bacterium]|nr:M48 family metallopeptidase [Clostridia bacterium]